MRVFAALSIPDWLTERVEPLLPPVGDGVRGIPAQRWHVTLAFYGELDDTRLQCVQRKLRQRLDTHDSSPRAGIGLRVDGGGSFSSDVGYLAVVAEDPSGDDRLRGLATTCRRVGMACEAPGTRIPGKRFHPHITVARSRRRGAIGADFTASLQGVRSDPWDANSVALVASFLGANPEYRILETFPIPG